MSKVSLIIATVALCFSLTGFSADPPMNEKPAWMALMQPNENHKAMNDIVGKFTFSMQWWEKAGDKPKDSKGTSVSKWIMGDRFVQAEVTSKMEGQPFKGMNITGFDNVKKEYQSIWFDNFGTGMMYSSGTKEDKKLFTQTGTYGCPMTGEKDRWFRNELKVIDSNSHIFTTFSKDTDGKEFKSMEITYKRKG